MSSRLYDRKFVLTGEGENNYLWRDTGTKPEKGAILIRPEGSYIVDVTISVTSNKVIVFVSKKS